MKFTRLAFLLLGLMLLVILLAQADLAEIWFEANRIGMQGVAFVLGLFAIAFWADAASWHVILDAVPIDWRWARRLYAIRMVGEAYNNITPLGSVGGEPVKAWLLKVNYGLRFSEVSATLILAKQTLIMSLVIFVTIGFFALLGNGKFGPEYRLAAGFGAGMMVLFATMFFLMQWLRLSTRAARLLGDTRIGQRLTGLLAFAENMDALFVRFYTERRLRITISIGFALASWLLGVVEIHFVMGLLGYPISWSEAWIVEALVQTVRTGTFFIPAGLGSQEGTLLLVCQTLTGDATVGLAFALVRRSRELVWIIGGLLLASRYHVSLSEVRHAEISD